MAVETNATNTPPSASQKPYAAIVAVVAILAVALVAGFAMLHYDSANSAVVVLSPVTAVISSLVAAYFGVRSGSLAQEKSNERAARGPNTPPQP